MKKLTYIDIVLENVEVLKFDVEYIDYISVDNIHKNTVYSHDNLHEYLQCDELYLMLHPSANKIENSTTDYTEKSLPFDRINAWQDIVSIELFYDDETSENIYVPYDGEEVNLLQSQIITSTGSMLVVCSKENTAEEWIK